MNMGIFVVLLLSGLVFLFFILLVVGVFFAFAIRNKDKTHWLRISEEEKKIDALLAKGKISKEEAEELKKVMASPTILTPASTGPDFHIKLVSILHIISGGLTLLALCFVGLLSSFATKIGSLKQSLNIGGNSIQLPPPPMPMLFLSCVLGCFVLYCIFQIYAGAMLFKGNNYARIAIIVLSVLSIANVPIGLVIGLYSLWVLVMRKESGDFFRKGNNILLTEFKTFKKAMFGIVISIMIIILIFVSLARTYNSSCVMTKAPCTTCTCTTSEYQLAPITFKLSKKQEDVIFYYDIKGPKNFAYSTRNDAFYRGTVSRNSKFIMSIKEEETAAGDNTVNTIYQQTRLIRKMKNNASTELPQPKFIANRLFSFQGKRKSFSHVIEYGTPDNVIKLTDEKRKKLFEINWKENNIKVIFWVKKSNE